MCSRYFILLYLTLFKCSQYNVWTFNVETSHYAIYRGDIHSMFGYAVAEYRDQNHRGWVIVGAPLNQTNHVGVVRGGAVFRCDIAEDNRCFPIEFDKNGTSYVSSKKNGVQAIDDKSYQWFGATISASMQDGGPLLACAPKYHWFGYIKSSWSVAGFKDAVGACWLASLNGGKAAEYSPCRNNDTAGHHRQGMCQAGIGAAITKDGKRIFMGAPGSWYWQGQLFTIESNVNLPFVPNKDPRDGYASSFDRLLSTKEGPAYEDNNYLGYSVSVGDFLGNGDSGVAVGVPRALELQGKVLLFTSQLYNHRNITGEQMGAYFGYALAVTDIDGDNKDDLIITAPFFTQPEFSEEKIETGRIYVFYQGGGVTPYQKFHTRDGTSNRGQFGLSVASLGDIDLDGYGDFVVGEPYGGPENRGAIYIYHGSQEGVEEKYSQVIYSEDLEQPVRTFGWSVSGGMDLDNNHYPDIVVGAYESNTALYLRSKPVIKMLTEINFITDSVNLKNKACVLANGDLVACSELKICCMYSGVGVWNQQEFTINISLDEKKKKNPRLFFLDYEDKSVYNWSVPVTKEEMYCRRLKVYVSNHLRDKLTSLDAEMSVELSKHSNQFINNWKKRDPKKTLMATLEPKNTKKRDALIIQKNCGSDNICVPDLMLSVTKGVEKYYLDSQENIKLSVVIQNYGEDAFESAFYMQLPKGIDFVKIENDKEASEILVQCTAPSVSNNNTLRCDVGNPLAEGKMVKFIVLLQPITLNSMKPSYEFTAKVNSTNPEKSETLHNNFKDVSIPLWIETNIEILGDSKPINIDLNSHEFQDIAPELYMTNLTYAPSFTHNYTIRNDGPSTVLQVAVSLIWAAEVKQVKGEKDRKILLYLTEQPETSEEKIKCESANYDSLSLFVKPKRRKTRSVAEDLTELQSLTNVLFVDPIANEKSLSEEEYARLSRQTEDHLSVSSEEEETNDESLIFKNKPLCNAASCVDLKCTVGPLKNGEEVWLAAKYRINVTALKELSTNENLQFWTTVVTRVDSQPFIGKPIEPIIKEQQIISTILPRKILPPVESIPLWLWILSACIGTLILLLLIYLLYKCGFFKRNRPSRPGPEREPLNGS